MNMSKCYKKYIKEWIQSKTKENAKKVLFKIKKYYYTNTTQHCHNIVIWTKQTIDARTNSIKKEVDNLEKTLKTL